MFKNIARFYICKFCGKVYWEGSHYENISAQFANILRLQEGSSCNSSPHDSEEFACGKSITEGSTRGRCRQNQGKVNPTRGRGRGNGRSRGGIAETVKKQKFEAHRDSQQGRFDRGYHADGSSVDGDGYGGLLDYSESSLFDPMNDYYNRLDEWDAGLYEGDHDFDYSELDPLQELYSTDLGYDYMF